MLKLDPTACTSKGNEAENDVDVSLQLRKNSFIRLPFSNPLAAAMGVGLCFFAL